jgi:acyl-homoserine lactone acylase PvdQ
MPDLTGPRGSGTGTIIQGDPLGLELPAVGAPDRPDTVDGPFGPIPLDFDTAAMSNALLVGGEHTTDGHPATVFGPQTGYYTPQLLTEQVLVGPGVKARGVAFAGTNLVVQLGRGVDYAWSATSASNDIVDTVVERLCNADGSRPTVRSTSYRVGKKCVPMRYDEHVERVLPNLTAPNPPKRYRFEVWRTRHGIVQTRTTVKGKPVAVVLERSTYGREVGSILGFARFNDPGYVTDARSFMKAARGVDYTFNWFYADDEDIAYYSSGRLPRRARGVDFDLPRWGGRRFDWKGWLPPSAHPQQVNPPSGYLVSWNNKTAPGFSAADNVWGYGPVYRSLALEDRVAAAVRAGDVDVTDVAAIVADAGTVDSRAAYTLPLLLRVIGRSPETAEARRLLRAWLADGAHRVDRDRDGSYAHQAAIALFDTWWEDGRRSIARDVVGDRLGRRLTRLLPQAIDDHPRQGLGSSWNGVAWYGYVNKDLRQVLGEKVGSPYRLSFCGRGRLAACRSTLRASLRQAVEHALETQGVETVSDLTYDKSLDFIRGTTAGTVGTRPIDWQNRPTFQQVVAFTAHRKR